jgi:hypothetical protein
MNVLEWMICSDNNCSKEYKFKKEGGGGSKRCILLCILQYSEDIQYCMQISEAVLTFAQNTQSVSSHTVQRIF